MEILQCEKNEVHEDMVLTVGAKLPSTERMIAMADFFKALGNDTRIRILQALLINEMCVCDISSVLNMTDSAISHQLKVLKNAKLVKNRREGKVIYYSIADHHVTKILNQTIEHIEESKEF